VQTRERFVLGDLNTQIGREEIYRVLIGRHSLHVNTNNNGQRLVDFAAAKKYGGIFNLLPT